MKIINFPFELLILVMSVCSCTRTYVYLVSYPYDLKLLNNTSVTIVGSDGLVLKGFIKTFNEKYENKHSFTTNYVTLFKNKLSQSGQFSLVHADTSYTWNLIKSFVGSKEDFFIIDSLFAKNNSDYIINIHPMEISNRFLNNTGTDANGNAMTTRKETCVVKARFQIIDRISRKPILEFESGGEKAVSFFNYKATLENAILTSMDHAVLYLQSGLTKFKK